ncbi:MAG TPA: chemotaxis protein CheB [Acetobacteraceae bacterium]|nr:chemotaxis protein CheB [Acetobacteraceae bacterium]
MADAKRRQRSQPVPARRRAKTAAVPSAPRADSGFPVVALGASAGGLVAVRGLLDAMPSNSGMAFVVIQHTAPTHDSLLVDLLASHTLMPVQQAGHGMAVVPNHVYVGPPGAYLAIERNTLVLSGPPEGANIRLPIDHFLQSLAIDRQQHAVCVILSGTGTDGSLGLQSVRQQGGLVIAQDPAEASYDGMPRSAIATGGVDLVLALKDIPKSLVAHSRRRRAVRPVQAGRPVPMLGAAVAAIIDAVKHRTGHDFTQYKDGTLLRRIERRMGMNRTNDPDEYLALVKQDPAEAELLAKDLLVSVTGFFRDPDAYKLLAEHISANLVGQHRGDRPIRAWVAGCSSGEEAYSIAMLLIELADAAQRRMGIQIFATDIDQDALQTGRSGLYPDSIAGAVSPERLSRFFIRQDHNYRVTTDLRECVVFAVHDLLSDPPFSRMDLVACRNVLIYLQPEVQQHVLSVFRYALNDDGTLFLGAAESPGAAATLFEPISKQAQIYRPTRQTRPMPVRLPIALPSRNPPSLAVAQAPAGRPRGNPEEIANRAMIEAYAPASVLINQHGEALYFHGAIDRYLAVGSGKASLDLAGMARSGLSAKLRLAVTLAVKHRDRQVLNGVQMRRGRRPALVTIDIRPVPADAEKLFLVSFVDEAQVVVEHSTRAKPTAAESSLLARIEQDLKTTREELQATILDLENSNEQLQSTNEQAMSLNEELQASNEELEASKEELQSMNEELSTLNTQLQENLQRQRIIGNDLQNVLSSSDAAMLFLDTGLHIRFFTPAIQRLFNIQQTDVGRPIGDFTRSFADPELTQDAGRTLTELVPIKREVLAETGSWFNRRVLPYLTADRKIEGVVVTFADITELKRAEQLATTAQVSAENIVNTVREPLVIVDDRLVVISANCAFYQFFGVTAAIAIGQKLRDVVGGALDAPEFNALIERLLADGEPVEGFETRSLSGSGDERIVVLNAREVRHEARGARRILVAMEDTTDSLRISRELRAARDVAETASNEKSHFLMAVSHDLRQPLQTMLLLQGVMAHQAQDEAARELVADFGAALDEMNDTMNALLDINQLQTGAIRPTVGDFPIHVLFDRIRSEFRETTRAKGLELRIVESSALLRTDHRLLERIVQNLMSNAVKYTDAGRILLGCRRRGDMVYIEVWDSGIGIPPDQLRLIFQENYRVNAPVGARNGMGLGLSIAERFAQLLGHRLDVRSTPGKGSVFWVEVPLSPASRAAQVRRAQRAYVAPPGGAKVLVVDDDEGVRGAMRTLLQAAGYAVGTYGSAEAFLAAERENNAVCLLIDNGLPGISGIELLETLRSRGDNIPAIIVTALAETQLAARAARAGVEDFLEKPVAGDVLLASVRRSLTAKGSGG